MGQPVPSAASLARATHIDFFRICIFDKCVTCCLCHFYFHAVRQELSTEEPLNVKLMEQLSPFLGDARPDDGRCIEMSNCVFVSLLPEEKK